MLPRTPRKLKRNFQSLYHNTKSFRPHSFHTTEIGSVYATALSLSNHIFPINKLDELISIS